MSSDVSDNLTPHWPESGVCLPDEPILCRLVDVVWILTWGDVVAVQLFASEIAEPHFFAQSGVRDRETKAAAAPKDCRSPAARSKFLALEPATNLTGSVSLPRKRVCTTLDPRRGPACPVQTADSRLSVLLAGPQWQRGRRVCCSSWSGDLCITRARAKILCLQQKEYKSLFFDRRLAFAPSS